MISSSSGRLRGNLPGIALTVPTADGFVLAGGRGRRLGRPKATALVAGRPLVTRAVEALLPICAHVLVVTRPDVELPPLADGVAVVHDRSGPDTALNALATGLAAAESDHVVALGCDLPLAAALVTRVAARRGGGAVVAHDPGGRPQPLCARYPRRSTLAAAERLLGAGETRLLTLLDAVDHALVEEGDELLNVNTPPDMARAEALLRPPRRDVS